MHPLTTMARDRLARLADTLTLLKERVREAVASEAAKAVGDAVRDLIAGVLDRDVALPRGHPSEEADDPWRDADPWYDATPSPARGRSNATPAEGTQRAAWSAALAVGAALLRRWASRRLPAWAWPGGVTRAIAAAASGPLAKAALAAAASAVDLTAIVCPRLEVFE